MRPKLADFAARAFFHALADFVYFTARHVVSFAVVPNELNVAQKLVTSFKLAAQEFRFDRPQIHRVLDDLRVVEQLKLLPRNGL